MSKLNFESCLSDQFERFVELRSLSSNDYQGQARLLLYFDRFLVKQKINKSRINRDITDRYQQSLSAFSPRYQENRCCVVKKFCEYLARNDPNSYVPESRRHIDSFSAHKPYIYSQDEIKLLIQAANDLPQYDSLWPHTYYTLLGLLYSTGVRISEALDLNLENFYANEQRIYIAEGKFRKSRWIALSASTCNALQLYIAKRLHQMPFSKESPLFLSQDHRRLCYSVVYRTFRHLLKQCGIAHKKNVSPRIHDMRHSFAVCRLLAWYRDGQNVNARLPALATYMGHVDIRSTQVYLQPTVELFGEVSDRFHSHFLKNINLLSGEKNESSIR